MVHRCLTGRTATAWSSTIFIRHGIKVLERKVKSNKCADPYCLFANYSHTIRGWCFRPRIGEQRIALIVAAALNCKTLRSWVVLSTEGVNGLQPGLKSRGRGRGTEAQDSFFRRGSAEGAATNKACQEVSDSLRTGMGYRLSPP